MQPGGRTLGSPGLRHKKSANNVVGAIQSLLVSLGGFLTAQFSWLRIVGALCIEARGSIIYACWNKSTSISNKVHSALFHKLFNYLLNLFYFMYWIGEIACSMQRNWLRGN